MLERKPAPDHLPLHRLGVVDIVAGIRERRFGAEDIVRSCLARIAERDPEIRAWVETDPDGAIAQARATAGSPAALAGVPVGVKDVIETAQFPTGMGSRLYEGNRRAYDGAVVAQLRMAGAIVLGKTTTCEFAGTAPTVTANPHDPRCTPGGSSSGSAAAVADFMVPLALGTQTGGSVLRPAAFCGIVGFKPTYGLYSPAGMKPAAASFDTVGMLARSVEDVALVHSVLMDAERAETASRPPRIGLLRTHLWETLEEPAARNFEQAAQRLGAAGAHLIDIAPPPGFERITQHRAVINAFERARGLAGEWMANRDLMTPETLSVCERGFAIKGDDYLAAHRAVEAFRHMASDFFGQIDCILTPVVPGEAPVGKQSTGDPRFQEIWSMLHMPSISVPSGKGQRGLPLGIQLVGARFADATLLSAARWVEAMLGEDNSAAA